MNVLCYACCIANIYVCTNKARATYEIFRMPFMDVYFITEDGHERVFVTVWSADCIEVASVELCTDEPRHNVGSPINVTENVHVEKVIKMLIVLYLMCILSSYESIYVLVIL